MPNFVYATVPLNYPKRDGEALPAGADPTEYFGAADINAICQALVDLRAALLGGLYYQLATNADITPSVPGTARIRFDGTSIQLSLDGGTWTDFRGPPGADGQQGPPGAPASAALLWFDLADRAAARDTSPLPAGDNTYGYSFLPYAPLLLLGFKVFHPEGIDRPLKCSLWNADGSTRLATKTAQTGSAAGLKTLMLDVPYPLTQNLEYLLGAYLPGANKFLRWPTPGVNPAAHPASPFLAGPDLEFLTLASYAAGDSAPLNNVSNLDPNNLAMVAPLLAVP